MTIEMPRRRFLAGLVGLVAAPAVIRVARLMPVKAIPANPLDFRLPYGRYRFPIVARLVARNATGGFLIWPEYVQDFEGVLRAQGLELPRPLIVAEHIAAD